MYQINRMKHVAMHGQINLISLYFYDGVNNSCCTHHCSSFKKSHGNERKKTKWVKPWLLQRPILGVYDALLAELRLAEEANYRNFLRMKPTDLKPGSTRYYEEGYKYEYASVCSIFLFLVEDNFHSVFCRVIILRIKENNSNHTVIG